MQCPVRGVELKVAERQGVEIDDCPQCCGVWLEPDELDKIIERSARDPRFQTNTAEDDESNPYEKRKRAGNARKIQDAYFDRYDTHRSRSGRKRPGGFLSDVFDFFGDD